MVWKSDEAGLMLASVSEHEREAASVTEGTLPLKLGSHARFTAQFYRPRPVFIMLS